VKRVGAALSVLCGRTGEDEDGWGEEEEERVLYDASDAAAPRGFYWTEALQASFRAELEKCVAHKEGEAGWLTGTPGSSSWTTSCGTRTAARTTT
jgi:hypothetical protein